MGPSFCCRQRQLLYLLIGCLAVGSVCRGWGQLKAVPATVNCVVTKTCPQPYASPDILKINQLPNGSISLKGLVAVQLNGEAQQGAWATQVIQTNTGLPPASQAEVIRLSQPLDQLYGEPLTDATITYGAPPTRVKNPSVIFEVPISFSTTGAPYYPYVPTNCEPGVEECFPQPEGDGVYGSYSARVEDCLSSSDNH